MKLKQLIALLIASALPTLVVAYPACPSDINGASAPCGANGSLTIEPSGSITGNITGTSGSTTRDFALSNPVASSITIYGSVTNNSTGNSGIGLWNYPSTTLSNLLIQSGGSITGASDGYAIRNEGYITNLGNYGSISGMSGIISSGASSIVALTNFSGGTISSNAALRNAIAIRDDSTLGTLNNYGSITQTVHDAIYVDGTVEKVNNYSEISGGRFGLWLKGGGVTEINNYESGRISGASSAIYTTSINAIGIKTINNSGIIESTGGGPAIFNGLYTIGTISNYSTGVIDGGIASNGTINSINNSGLINGGSPFAGAITNGGSIANITNNNQITGTNGIYNTGTIGTINNLGSSAFISSSNQEIYNEGTISNIYNSGTFRWGYNSIFNSASGQIGAIENSTTGQIYASHIGIYNEGTIGTFINKGTILTGDDIAIVNTGNIGTLANEGQLAGVIQNWSTIGTITNSGSIEGSINSAILNSGTIGTINNSGTISSTNFDAISNNGTITSLYNSGTINSSSYLGIANNGGTIQTLTNAGTIIGGIYNWTGGGNIVNLNNAQGFGNSAGALTYFGALPTNYNIIVNSPTRYGQLAASGISGSTHFGIYSGSMLTKGTYSSVLSGFASGSNVNATSGNFNGTGWRLVESGAGTGIWDLVADFSATNTLQSVQMNATGLSTVYNQQAAAYQAALSYDCQVYDEAGLCVSFGGRYTYAGPSPSSNQQAGLVVVGYKPVQTVRVGAFADQSVNISTPSGFSQSKSSPMWGLFAKWHRNKDETGLGVQASAVTSSSSLSVTRSQLFNTEAGSGTTQFNGQGYQLTTNYHQPVTDSTALVPYIGMRYTRINAGAYTENTTATVISPISYNAMAQNTFSAIGGLGVRSHLAEKLIGTASIGIQQNLKYSMGNYAGTSNIMGLESFSTQMPGNVNSMATATAGLYYDVRKNERVGLNVLWQQQPFIATNTATALATYSIGF